MSIRPKRQTVSLKHSSELWYQKGFLEIRLHRLVETAADHLGQRGQHEGAAEGPADGGAADVDLDVVNHTVIPLDLHRVVHSQQIALHIGSDVLFGGSAGQQREQRDLLVVSAPKPQNHVFPID